MSHGTDVYYLDTELPTGMQAGNYAIEIIRDYSGNITGGTLQPATATSGTDYNG